LNQEGWAESISNENSQLGQFAEHLQGTRYLQATELSAVRRPPPYVTVDSYARITGSSVGGLDRKQLLDASGLCANAAAMAESAPLSRSFRSWKRGTSEKRKAGRSAALPRCRSDRAIAGDRSPGKRSGSVSCGTSGRIVKKRPLQK
jgi:hypothetical protein